MAVDISVLALMWALASILLAGARAILDQYLATGEMMDSDRRGAPMARREEWSWVAPNDRRATQPAGMDRRSESVISPVVRY
jgi:hypothetical protein